MKDTLNFKFCYRHSTLKSKTVLAAMLCSSTLGLGGCFDKSSAGSNGGTPSPSPTPVVNSEIVFSGNPSVSSNTFISDEPDTVDDITVDVDSQTTAFLTTSPHHQAVLSASDESTSFADENQKLMILTQPMTLIGPDERTIQVKQNPSHSTKLGKHEVVLTLRNEDGKTQKETVEFTVNDNLGMTITDLEIAGDSGASDVIVGSMDAHLHVSNDHGGQWASIDTGSKLPVVSVAISDNGTYMLGGGENDKLYLSSDHGHTFKTLDIDQVAGNSFYHVAMSGSGRVMAANTTHTSAKLFISTDYGKSWQAQAINSDGVGALAVSKDGQHIITAGDRVYTLSLNTDQNNWSVKAHGSLEHWFMNDAAISDDGHVMAATEGTVILYSMDSGMHWQRKDTVSRRWVYAIAVSGDGSHILAGGEHGFTSVYSASDDNWREFAREEIHSTINSVAVSRDGQSMLSGGSGSPVRISRDGGASWQDLADSMPRNDLDSIVAMTGDGHYMAYGARDHNIHISSDYGQHFH